MSTPVSPTPGPLHLFDNGPGKWVNGSMNPITFSNPEYYPSAGGFLIGHPLAVRAALGFGER